MRQTPLDDRRHESAIRRNGAIHSTIYEIMSFFKRLLMFVLILLFIAACGLWIMGGKKNEYSTSLSIDAAPDQIFPYLVEPDRMKKWIKGLDQIEQLRPAEDPHQAVPQTSRVVSDDSGNPQQFRDEVLRYSEGKGLSIQSTNAFQIIVSVFQLEPEQGKTRLEYRVKTTNVGFGRMLAPLQSQDFRSRMESDAQRLKELVESTEPKVESVPDDDELDVAPAYKVPNFESSAAINELESSDK